MGSSQSASEETGPSDDGDGPGQLQRPCKDLKYLYLKLHRYLGVVVGVVRTARSYF